MPIKFGIHQPMFSARDDADGRTYKLLIGKSKKRWLVANQAAAAENIYVEGGSNSDGFGGATLSFELEDGTSLSLKGPWKTGADALFKDTGFDVRDKYFTQGIVACQRIYSDWPRPDFYVGILHRDECPVLGTYDRIDLIAQAWANKLGVKLPYGIISKGGGSAGWKTPEQNVIAA